MLEEEGCTANSNAKQAITDFSILYAKKLLKKCLFPNKDSINPDDLRYLAFYPESPTKR